MNKLFKKIFLCMLIFMIFSLFTLSTFNKKVSYAQEVIGAYPLSYDDVYESQIPNKYHLLDVDPLDQNPELYNGCEVTSLTMLLNYKGVDVSKLELADNIPKDITELLSDEDGNILEWGDPDIGFVGDITGYYDIGITVNPGPITDLLKQYYPNGINLTGCSIETIKDYISKDNPVMVWVTINFEEPDFITWQTPNNKEITSDFNVHCILITGYDSDYIYYNDPLTGEKNNSIEINIFNDIWNEIGSKAVSTYK